MKNLKPFDLQEALSGKAVMLRNGDKAFVRHHETELDVAKSHKLLGYRNGRQMEWNENGSYLAAQTTSDGDIIGMYPDTHIVNEFEVSAPEIEPPKENIQYFIPILHSNKHFYSAHKWHCHELDELWLKRGLVFLNKEHAIANAKAMIGIDPYK